MHIIEIKSLIISYIILNCTNIQYLPCTKYEIGYKFGPATVKKY